MKATAPRLQPPSSAAGNRVAEALSKKRLKRLAGSLKKQWKRHRKALKRCQKKLSEAAIHESRVETRRLLATAELLGGFAEAHRLKKAQAAIKEYLDNFDELRDTQVQLLAVGKLLRQYPSARPFHAYLRKREERLAKKTRKKISKVRTGHLAKLIAGVRGDIDLQLARCSATAATAILARSVERAFHRTIQLRKAIDPGNTDTIHRTRVSFKKFRYMVEALAAHLPNVTDDLLEQMHHYQTMMGEIQDAVVLLAAWDKFARKEEVTPGATKRFRAELLRRRQWLIRVYLDGANQLLNFWPPQKRSTFTARPEGENAR